MCVCVCAHVRVCVCVCVCAVASCMKGCQSRDKILLVGIGLNGGIYTELTQILAFLF